MRPFGIGSRIAIALVLLCACCSICGCRSSGIDPTGEHIFASPPPQGPSQYRPYPGNSLPWDNVQVIVTPSRCVAPVGSDVVLMAGVLGPDGYLRTNERVEWLLSPESPGQLVDFGRGTLVDLMLGDFTRPRKLNNHWAVTSTSRRYLRLNRETPTPTDDVLLARGQSWVTIASPVEGSSYVTAYAPSVYGWHAQKQVATIHWVDAEWRFPPPAITPAGGRAVFTTTVTRHTDKSPRPGWQVRYTIVGGPPAGFAPDGAQTIEVATNQAGQANAEIVQTEATSGSNQINIQIIRPAAIDGDGGKPLVVGSGSTMATWSAPELSIRKTGPAVGAVGATLNYRITVTNPGDLPAEGVTVVDEIPAGLELLKTAPPSETSGGRLQWHIGRLGPHATRVFGVDLRATRAGTITSCAEATGATGLRARHCLTTTIGTPSLRIRIVGPTSAKVGDEVRFEIVVENHGQMTATGLEISDRYDEGLEFPGEPSPIRKELADLPPGQGHRVGVMFRVTRPGRLCHDVTVSGNAGVRVTERACIDVVPGALPPGTTPDAAPLTGRAAVSVKKTGPVVAEVGQTVEFQIILRNTGKMPLSGVKIVDTYDEPLRPTKATEGRQLVDHNLIWTIPSLPIGMASTLRVQCRCESAAAQTYNRVTVTTAEGAQAKDEARLEVKAVRGPTIPDRSSLPDRPPAAQRPGLSMEVIDWADQVAVGRSITYEIVVSNNSTTPDQDVTLEVDVPAQMEPVDMGTRGPLGVRHAIDGQTIRFERVGAIRPGDKLRYEVRVKAKAPGKMQLRARLRSQRLTEELQADEETEIYDST